MEQAISMEPPPAGALTNREAYLNFLLSPTERGDEEFCIASQARWTASSRRRHCFLMMREIFTEQPSRGAALMLASFLSCPQLPAAHGARRFSTSFKDPMAHTRLEGWHSTRSGTFTAPRRRVGQPAAAQFSSCRLPRTEPGPT